MVFLYFPKNSKLAPQYNDPPIYPTTQICKAIDRASNVDTDILDRVFVGTVAYHVPPIPCSNMSYDPSQSDIGWQWQSCSEDIGNIGITSNDSMFPKSPFDLQQYINDCKKLYGVAPRVHWMTTYYGGHDIKLVLGKFGSNIIFSNGLTDPYSSGGVLENISDTILAVTTVKGSHCLDILKSKKTDPEWLIKQRNKEVTIIKQWLTKYYQSLRLLQQSSRP